MTRPEMKKFYSLAVLALALASSAWGTLHFADTTRDATMTRKMKTVCVGRFLIDMPQESTVWLGQARVGGFDLANSRQTDDAFKASTSAREAELGAQVNELGKPSLEAVREYRRNGYSGKVFVFGRWRTSWMEGDRRVHAEGVAVEGYLHGNGATFSFSSSTADPKQADRMLKLFEQVSVRDEAEAPASPGLCIGNGFIREPLDAEQREFVTLFAKMHEHPDVGIAFSTTVGAAAGPGLLKRSEQAMTNYPFLRPAVKILREGARTINGVPGEEIAAKVTEKSFTTSFTFDWEVRGKHMDVHAPLLTLELQTGLARPGGKPLQSSLAEEAVAELWDRMVQSIRLRPATAATETIVQPPTVKLGTAVMAGEACPVAGWWQCNEGGDGVGVLGGKRQFLRKGQRLPQALLLPQPKLWEKVRGLQPSYEAGAPTAWKLVDKRVAPRNHGTVPLAEAAPGAELDTWAGAAALGTCARTGEPCPASGWWRCDDAQALDGTRWFGQGSLLPVATFSMPASWFGKNTGGPTVIQRRSSWQLVRHAAAPDPRSAEASRCPVPEGSPA
jgi:hypothetical protein